jgi:colanic acid/amylovoran biosynthesis glycosyltransferase
MLLHSGIDTNFFVRKEYKQKEGQFVFLQVSSFYQRKGHKYALEAFAKFIQENKKFEYKFLIVGFGPLKNEIAAQIKALNLQNNVEMRTPVTPAEMVELASQANCFVHMSIVSDNGEEEGLPNVILEAMALELPILTTKHAGIPEIVDDRKNGLLCEEKDIEGYVKAMHEIVEWKCLKENREKIINQFSFESHMQKLEDIYQELVKKNSR